MLARGFGSGVMSKMDGPGAPDGERTMTAQGLNDEGCLRLLAAVVLQWWRDAERVGEHDELAAFLGVPSDEVRGVRPLRIDRWRRKDLIGRRAEGADEDVF